jgi:hypothetical protein
LSVCGLCREGYNDPDIGCVAIFRPVSKKASSLAEQMKGRGCRPCRSVIPVLNRLATPEERVAAIAASEKPDCLIVDLVGATGLPDCASTVQIYTEGLSDEETLRAAELLEQGGREEGGADVEQAVKRARAEIEAERAAEERRRREEAEKRAKAEAQVRWSEHAVGVGAGTDIQPDQATPKQYKFLAHLGVKPLVPVSKRKASHMIDSLKEWRPREQVARQYALKSGDWEPVGPSPKQTRRLQQAGISVCVTDTPRVASELIDAKERPTAFEEKMRGEITAATCDATLNQISRLIGRAKPVLPPGQYDRLVKEGLAKRSAIAV